MGDSASTVSMEKETAGFRWMILVLAFLCFWFTFVVRFAWPPLIPVVAPVLGMKMTEAGAFMSAFYFGYVITQLPSGMIADRFGVRFILAVSLIIQGIATFFMGSIGSFSPGVILRVITGLAAGCVFACVTRTIMLWFSPKERGIAFGVLMCGHGAGVLAANYLAPLFNGVWGWQGAFRGLGAITVIIGILAYLGLSKDKPMPTKGSAFGGFKIFFGDRNLVIIAIASFLLMWMNMGMGSFGNAFVKSLGFTVKQAGYVMMLQGFGGIIGCLCSGWISDKTGRPRALSVVAYLIVIPMIYIFFKVSSFGTLCVVGFIFGILCFLPNAAGQVLITQFAPKQYAASCFACWNFIVQIAAFVVPMVLGASIDISGGFSGLWYILGIAPFVGAFMYLLIKPKTVEEQMQAEAS